MTQAAALGARDQARRRRASQGARRPSLDRRRGWREGGDDDDGLGERRLVGQADIETHLHAGRGYRLEAGERAAGQPQAGLARGQVDDPEVAPEDAAPETRTERLGGGLLGGKAAGVAGAAGQAAAIAAATLGLGEDAVEKAVAETLDRLFDAADVDQVAADAEDHRTGTLLIGIASSLC